MVGARCCVCCRFLQGLIVGFILLKYSGDDLWISMGHFMRTKQFSYRLLQGGVSFVDLFRYLLFLFVFANTRCLFVATLWSPVGEGLSSLLSWMRCCLMFLSLSLRCPGSVVVLDCINSWSLPSSLLWIKMILTDFNSSSCICDVTAVFVMSQKVTQKVTLKT